GSRPSKLSWTWWRKKSHAASPGPGRAGKRPEPRDESDGRADVGQERENQPLAALLGGVPVGPAADPAKLGLPHLGARFGPGSGRLLALPIRRLPRGGYHPEGFGPLQRLAPLDRAGQRRDDRCADHG